MGLLLFMKPFETIIQHDQKLKGPSLDFLMMLFLTGTLRLSSNLPFIWIKKSGQIRLEIKGHDRKRSAHFKQQSCKNAKFQFLNSLSPSVSPLPFYLHGKIAARGFQRKNLPN